MPRFRVRMSTIVEREIEAFDIQSAERQAKFIAGGIRFNDSDGEPQHAALYSIEEIKDNNAKPRPTDPLSPRPQRKFAA